MSLDGTLYHKAESVAQKSELENKKNENHDLPSAIVKVNPPEPEPKKSAKLKFKHFFSPIRKKSVVAQPAPSAPQQADVFVSNAIANNLNVNKQKSMQQDIIKPEKMEVKSSSPVPTFQVRFFGF